MHQNRMTKKFRADLICGMPSNIQFINLCLPICCLKTWILKLHKNVILHVFLFGYKICPVTLKKENIWLEVGRSDSRLQEFA